EVGQRVTFTPTEIDMWQLPCFVSQVQKKGGDRIRHSGRLCAQYLETINSLAADAQRSGKLRRISKCYLKEQDRFSRWNMIVRALLTLFCLILKNITLIFAIGNYANRAASCFANKVTREIIKF